MKKFIGISGAFENVILKSDRTLKADLAVVGVGVVPATEPFKDISGINIDKPGYIPDDSKMTTFVSSCFAAGDNVSSLCSPMERKGSPLVTNMYLGRVAALNIMGKERDVHTVPFFWTVQFGLSLRNVGLGS